MRIPFTLRYAVAACIALSMLAEPSRGASRAFQPHMQLYAASQPIQLQAVETSYLNGSRTTRGGIVPGHRPGTPSFFNRRAAGKPLIFISDLSGNAVDIYPQAAKNQKMIGQITGLNRPEGLAADSTGDVYIANSNTPQVLVYAPPYTNGPKLTLDDTGYLPQDLAVSPLGVVAVANFCNNSSCNSEYVVSFYPANSTRACATVSVPTPAVVSSVAFDANENLYLVGQKNFDNYVGEIRGACKATQTTPLAVGIIVGALFSVQVDKAGRIAICCSISGIDTYDPPKNGLLGIPVSATAIPGSAALTFTFLASGFDLYTAGFGVADEFDYPAGGVAKKSINLGYTAGGEAVTPPLVP